MRPVSIALGGVFALILTDAAAAAPLKPQTPLPQSRQPGGQTYFVACASRKPAPMVHTVGGAKGQPASRNAGAGAGRGQTACPPSRH